MKYDGVSGHNGLGDALRELQEAVRTRRPDPICSAYRHLRKAARGMKLDELFARADEALDEPLQPLVISAFSHWHCFMCDDGASVCDQCEGGGKDEDGETCSGCDGLGFTPCDFCRGTGWVDRDLIPPELKRVVMKNQVSAVKKELNRLRQTLPTISDKQLRSLPHAERLKLARRLMRLQARMYELVDSGAVDAEHADLYRRAAAGLDKAINPLRESAP